MRIAPALFVVTVALWPGAPALAEDAAPATEPAPAAASSAPSSAAAEDEVPAAVIEFFSSPGVASTLIVAFDYLCRHAAVIQGSLTGCLTGCVVGGATPVALNVLSPLLGGPRFDFAGIGGPLWAALPGAAIGAGLLAPLWATGKGLKYEHERGEFIGLAFPEVADEVPEIVYRDAVTAAVLGIVAAGVPTAAGIGMLMLGGSGEANAWHWLSIPFFAGALLAAASVTDGLYPDFVARHDPYVKAGAQAGEQEIKRLADMIGHMIEEAEREQEEQEEQEEHAEHAEQEQPAADEQGGGS
ncbi:MAG: hypothetical protein JXR83_20140 [Deltaproteobacteria bacterium]|nr:hypothetical protein [Deltaproteobacteria bacterium]